MNNQEQLEKFIGKCVLDNAVVNYSSRVGITQPMTVQDLCAASVTTLRQVGTQLEKAQKNSTASRFNNEGPLKIAGIPVEEWLNFIENLITKKEKDQEIQAHKDELALITKELNNLKTPAERKKELQKRQQALEAQL